MRVLFFPVGEPPITKDINGSLESMQAAVGGGLIQIAPIAQDLDLVCNEEGKFNGARANRVVPELHDVIFGPFFVMSHDGEGRSAGLDEPQLDRVRSRSWPAR